MEIASWYEVGFYRAFFLGTSERGISVRIYTFYINRDISTLAINEISIITFQIICYIDIEQFNLFTQVSLQFLNSYKFFKES